MSKSYEYYLPELPFKASRVYPSVNEAERAYWRARGGLERAEYGSPSQLKTGKDLKAVKDRYYGKEADYYATRLAYGPSFSSRKKSGGRIAGRPFYVALPELPFGYFGVIPDEVAKKCKRTTYKTRLAAEKAAIALREDELRRLGFDPDEYPLYVTDFEPGREG